MKPHIRLNMIVKNEATIILRCLESVKPYIDSWVIVDTGSSDSTIPIISHCMQGIPGKIYQRPWKNFGHNRTEALRLATSYDTSATTLAHADYLLFIDADETLQAEPNFSWPELSNTAYHFTCLYNNIRYQRNALVSTKLNWQWQGVLHEYLLSDQAHEWQLCPGLNIVIQHDGARAKDAHIYLKDIATLQQGLVDEPENTRYQFYLAQSYYDAGLLAPALSAYTQRATMAGFEEERWMAQLRAAQITEKLNLPMESIYVGYLQAWMQRPQRAEPVYELARFYRERGLYETACHFAQQAVAINMPNDLLFVDASVYEWRALDELSVSASYCPQYAAAGKLAIQQLLQEKRFPAAESARIQANLAFYG